MKFKLCLALLIIGMLFMLPSAMGQKPLPDSTGAKVKVMKPLDSVFLANPKSSAYGSFAGGILAVDDIFHAAAAAPKVPVLIRTVESKDWIFYLYCTLLLFLSFMQLAFNKYFHDLFRVFFNISLRQKQIREQLTQAPLPSLMLNIFFFLTGGVFIYFLLDYYVQHSDYAAPLEIFIAVTGLAIIYLVKFIFISLLGWIFDKKDASENYLFVVFMVNKVAGLMLLPLGILLAYSWGGWRQVMVTLAFTCLVLLVIIRMIKGYHSVSNILKINPLHFIVFVVAFEVIPLLLIYRVLLRVIE